MESPQGWDGDGEKMKEYRGWVKWEELKEREWKRDEGSEEAKNRGVKKYFETENRVKSINVCVSVFPNVCEWEQVDVTGEIQRTNNNVTYNVYVNNLLCLYCAVLQTAGMRWVWALSMTGTEWHHMKQLCLLWGANEKSSVVLIYQHATHRQLDRLRERMRLNMVIKNRYCSLQFHGAVI